MIRIYNIAPTWKELFLQSISIPFIILFTHAAVTKLIIWKKFRIQLNQFPFIGPFAEWVVWLIPIIQILISFLFLFTGLRLIAFFSSLILLLIFTLYIIAVLNFSESILFSCGGVVSSWTWNQQLIFNTGCIILAFLGIFISSRKDRVKNLIQNIKFK